MSKDLERTATGVTVVYGHDHAGLALLPLSLALKDPSQLKGAVTFRYELEVDGKPQRVRITLEPGDSGELPVHGDQMVYLAMLQLALRDSEPGEALTFRRTEVFDLLRWPKRGSRYDRLRASLKRLWELGIVFDSAMVARNGQEYNRETRLSRLIEDVHIGRGRDAPVTVRWGNIVKEAFQLGDFKRLDWDLLTELGNPLTAQLYRLLDRVTLSGYTRWEVDWKSLASALGMSVESYARPARLRQVLDPHFESLIRQHVIDGVDYRRGGVFVFHVRNHLRVEIRRALESLGVYEQAGVHLLTAFDEVAIMVQCDCLVHGSRPRPKAPGGYLVEAIRNRYELHYSDEEPIQFAALWGMLSVAERQAYHQAGLRLCGVGDSLFDTNPDPSAWGIELRAVVRFMVTHNVDPVEIARTPATLGPSLPTGQQVV